MLKQRIITALTILPFVLGFIWLGGVYLVALSLLIVGICCYEGFSFVSNKKSLFLSLLAILSLLPSFGYLSYSWPGLVAMTLLAILSLLTLTLIELENSEHQNNFSEAVPKYLAVFAWLAGLGTALVVLAAQTDSQLAIFWLLTVVIATDTGAYFTGRAIGGKKLSPRVSPGKTISGAIGGLVLAVVAGLLVAQYFSFPLNFAQISLFSVTASILSQFGDLFESMFKRAYGLKDSGSLIPGHGGLLDRVDGLLAAAPIMFLFPAS